MNFKAEMEWSKFQIVILPKNNKKGIEREADVAYFMQTKPKHFDNLYSSLHFCQSAAVTHIYHL